MPSSSNSALLIRYYSKLVETYIQLTLYEEAEATASRVLAVDPSNLIVRLKRGHARRRIGHLVGALADFETVLSIPPKPNTAQVLHYDEALRQRDIVIDILGVSYHELASAHTSQIALYNKPIYTDNPPSPNEKESLDEPSATPCRFYNHLGCRRGKKCTFSHAPDVRSIRDDRGKNVCLFFLIGKCKWDMFTCIYSHSKDDLAPEYKVDDTSRPAWWEDPLRREVVSERITERDARRKKLHEQNELAKQRNSKKSKKKKKKNGNVDSNANTNKPPASSSSHSNGDETLIFEWESDSDGEFEEEFEDVESPDVDLLSYEVKPWEHEVTKVTALLVALHP